MLILYSALIGVLILLVIISLRQEKKVTLTPPSISQLLPTFAPQDATNTFSLDNKGRSELAPERVSDTMKALTGKSLFPQAVFRDWTGFNQIPAPVTRSKYFFKTTYTIDEVRTIAKALAADSKIKKYGNTIFSSTIGEDGQLGAILLFETNTGYFHYSAFPGMRLPEPQHDTNTRIYELLKKLNIYDPTMQITAAYKKKSFEGSMFYEVKRNWAITGLPILNPIGLLNIRESTKLTDLTFTSNSTSTNKNEDIIETSDFTDGFDRRDDFNTMTIQIQESNGRILSIISNLRKTAAKSDDNILIPYDEAASSLRKGEGFILTTPGGDGTEIPWEKMYPNQTAESNLAVITESTLAYLEQSPGVAQSSLEPFYLFRGTADLKSGYATNFIAAVPATKSPRKQSFNIFPFSIIPKAHAQQNDASQKQSGFQLLTATPDPNPPPEFIFAVANCYPRTDELNPHYELRSSNLAVNQNVTFGFSHRAIINGQITYSRQGWWYMIPAPNSDVNILKNDYEKVLLAIKSITGERNYRAFLNVLGQGVYPDFQVTGSACPIRITGESPTVFVYAPKGTELTVQPVAALTYSDPVPDDNGVWNVRVVNKGILNVNDIYERQYLYYEYDPDISFSRPPAGWRVQRSDLSPFMEKYLIEPMKLNHDESKRLVFEINHAVESVKGDDLFIGILDRYEVDTKLPLKVSPDNIPVTRIHFYVGRYDNDQDIPQQHMTEIPRYEKMIVELGGWGEKE